jgi:predicted phosphodiesterase
MQFGALGDIHGDFDSVHRIVRRHPDIPFWLCVGDVADAEGRYVGFDAPIYWIHGNNDNFDAIADRRLPPHLHYLPSAQRLQLGGLSVAGLGGTFAPNWYDTPAEALPHPRKGTARATELADKRRHFVREQVDGCKTLPAVDVFLTHEAAKPFRPFPAGRGPDAGKIQINEILAAMGPRLHLFGHHHRFTEQRREGVPSVGLDLVSASYLLISAETLEYVKLES